MQKSYELFLASQLIAMHEDAGKGAREVANFADEHDDPVTSDMMMDALKFHEKAIWMLRTIVTRQ